MAGQRAHDANLCPGLEQLRRNANAAELRDSVGFTNVFPRAAVLVDGVDVKIAVRISSLVLLHRAGDVDLLVGVEVWRKAVMRPRLCDAKHDAGNERANRGSRNHETPLDDHR